MESDDKHLSKNGCFLSSVVREERTDALTDRPDLQLRLVQIFFRHGARTPIRRTPGFEEVEWNKDDMFMEEDFHKCDYEVYSLDGKSGPHDSVIEQSHQQANFYKSISHRGRLTTLGMNQTYELGTYFKKHYIDNLQFLSPRFNKSDIYMRSTNIERNIKSMSCVLAAMYGDDLKTKQNGLPRVHVDHASTEILYPNFSALHIEDTDVVPGVRPVRLQVQELLEQDPDEVHLDVIGLRDSISAMWVHDIPMFPGLEPLGSSVERAAVDIMKCCFTDESPAKQKLAYSIGPLLNLIVENMLKVTTGESRLKLHLYACHDTSLIPLLIVLGAYRDAWPGFCSDLIVEMYQDNEGRHFVRLLFLGKEVKFGPSAGTLVPLSQFRACLAPILVSEEDYRKTLPKVETF